MWHSGIALLYSPSCVYAYDDSRRPLYCIRLVGRLSRVDIEALERDLVAMLEAREPYGCVLDLTEFEFPRSETMSTAMRISVRTSKLTKAIYENPAAPVPFYTAYATSPRLAKFVHYLYRLPARAMAPPQVFASFDEALAATERALAGFGVAIPRASA